MKNLCYELIDLAKLTPKEWGEEIFDRNTALLEKLELVNPYIGMKKIDIPKATCDFITEKVPFGCPHCKHVDMDCQKCIWSNFAEVLEAIESCEDDNGGYRFLKVKKAKEYTCLDIRFFDISFCELQEYPLNVNYGRDDARLYLIYLKEITQEAYEECENFLKGHIEWANLIMETGLEYVREPKRIV